MLSKASSKPADSTANLGFEAKLWLTADSALRDSAFLQSEASPQVVSEAKDNSRKDDDVRWQPSGARQIAKGNPQGERGGVHQFGVPPKGNANFPWVQHFISN